MHNGFSDDNNDKAAEVEAYHHAHWINTPVIASLIPHPIHTVMCMFYTGSIQMELITSFCSHLTLLSEA